MKLLITGDKHLTGKTPCSRTDNFPDTQYKKEEQIRNICWEHDIDAALQPGDFFDSYNPSFGLVKKYMDLFLDGRREEKWYCILGQHDMYMWSLESVNRTPLALLESAEVLTIVRDTHRLGDGTTDAVNLYGCSWGQSIPTVKEVDIGEFNILMIHGTIGDKPLFPGHNIVHPKKFLEVWKEFDLVVCGDYHYPFEYTVGDRTIINAGVSSRKSIAERFISPSVVVFDTKTRTKKWIKLDCEENPFIVVPEKSSGGALSVDSFVNEIKNAELAEISFRDQVLQALGSGILNKHDTKMASDILNSIIR